jgi:hypothetical protein
MAKTGKLSNTEKYAIQGMMHEGLEVADIATKLDRTEVSISKYIDGELDELVGTIAKAQLQSSEPKEEVVEEQERAHASEEDIENAVYHLKLNLNLNEDRAYEMVDRVLRSIEFDIDSGRQLYALCVRTLNAKDVMVTETQGLRKPGVTMMTEAASERGDESKKKTSTSRTAKGNIFNPKQGKMAK